MIFFNLLLEGLHNVDEETVFIMFGFISNLDLIFANVAYLLFIFLFTLRIFILPIGFVNRYAVICE